LAVSLGGALRYPADVAPFAAMETTGKQAMRDLGSLLGPGEAVWLEGRGYPPVADILVEASLECLQMWLPETIELPDPPGITIEQLSGANAAEMVTLTDAAFPGFFRPRTYLMGSYYGIRSREGQLIAMGGERLMLPGFPEISGVCTLPEQRGRGLASAIIWRLVGSHRAAGCTSWLHVVADNARAIALYTSMGFEIARRVDLTRVRRTA
jgi:ribosomal protein S18 acetylase RimI-like enzyme